MTYRRIFAVLVTLLLLFTACTASELPERGNSVTTLTGVYEKTVLEMDERITYIRNMTLRDGKIYMYTTMIDGEERLASVVILDPADDSFTYENVPGMAYATVFAVGEEGYLFMLSDHDDLQKKEGYILYSVADGAVVWEKRLDEFTDVGDRLSRMPSVVWKDGTWYIGAESTLLLVDNAGNPVKSHTLPADIFGVLEADGAVRVWGNGFCYAVGADGSLTEDAAWKDALAQMPENTETIYPGNGYDFYYNGGEELIGCEVGGESVPLMNWVNCGFMTNRVPEIAVVALETIYIHDGENRILKFTGAPDREVEKTVIRVGYENSGTSNIEMAAVEFNGAQTEYQVICENYGEAEGHAAEMSGLDAAILRGETADLLLFRSMDEVAKYADKGLLADLYSLMDDEFSADDLFGSVREASEIGGKLYGLPRTFEISVFSAKTANLPDYDVWDVDAFLTTARNLPEGMRFSEDDSQEFMTAMLGFMLSEWVDTETNTCRFGDGSFAAMLDYIASLPEKSQWKSSPEENPFAADKILLYGYAVNNYASYAMINSVFGGWNSGTVVGLPSSEGGACLIHSDQYYAVSAESGNKEGAMAFLNFLLSEESLIGRTERVRGMDALPALKSVMKAWEAVDGVYPYRIYTDRVGKYSGGGELTVQDNTGRPYVEVYAADFAEEFCEFLDTVPAYRTVPAEIQEIVMEEVTAFLGMGKTAESTADIVQSRVGLWLSEHE